MLGRVAQVIFAPDHMRDSHFKIIDHVNQMKHRLPVRAHEHEVRILRLAVRRLTGNISHDEIGNRDGFAWHAEADRAVVFVGTTMRQELLHMLLVERLTLALKVRAVLAVAWAGRVTGDGAFIPFQSKPAQSVEDDLDSLLGVTGGIGVLDSKDESA